MSHSRRKLLGLWATGLFFSLFFGQSAQAGFGVSPPEISEDHLVPGIKVERTVYLVQGNPETALNMEVVVDSPTNKDWFSFLPGQRFTIPAGVQQFPLTVIVNVPKDAELGIYKAFLRVNTVPDTVQGAGQVAIALGGRVTVELTVGDDVFKSYLTRNIKILDIRAGEKPRVLVEVENNGNVPAAPSGASFELFNKFGNIRLAYGEYHEFESVPAFESRRFELLFPIDIRLAEGEYWGHVKIYNDDGGVMQELKTVFNVTPGIPWAKILSVGVPVLLVVLGIAIFLMRGRRRSRR